MKSDRKVYSPDIQVYSLEGSQGIFRVLASIVVAPIRIVTRVMHNVGILPANLMHQYSIALYVVGGIMAGVGFLDLIFMEKWPLLVSQIPVFYLAYRLNYQAKRAIFASQKKREVDIDTDAVEALVDKVYDELDSVFKEDKI